MCGIVGFWGPGHGHAQMLRDLHAGINALRHRGPDDSGSWDDDKLAVGLGHTRLSILDLSSHGKQPVLSGDGRLVMVYNGEVYNFREIRGQLEARGHRFQGCGDSEVIIAAFREWGAKAIHRFIGMFAIAVWDNETRELLLVRDRVGVKPLYYGVAGRTLCFASELKALRSFTHWQPRVRTAAVSEFLQYGYIHAPTTIYESVFMLPPGSMLRVRESCATQVETYWTLDDEKYELVNDGFEDNTPRDLEALLGDAFTKRLIADVPVGVFLSGGIDSSLVAALLKKYSHQEIHTFTIGFEDLNYDEAPWAKKVAQHLGTKHTELYLSADRGKEVFEKWAQLYDEPFGDSSGIPTYLVSSLAREHVKVALSADGGDELFAGYDHYTLAPQRTALLRRLPVAVRKTLAWTLGKLSPATLRSIFGSVPGRVVGFKLGDRLVKLRGVLPEVLPPQVFDLSVSHWLPSEADRLVGKNADSRLQTSDYPGTFEEQMMRWDFAHYLPGDILTKVDRASMAVGLECREPFLDHRVVRKAFSMELEDKIRPFGQKSALKEILYRHVPRQLVDRPKQGFSIPLPQWLAGGFEAEIDRLLNPDVILKHGLVDPDLVGLAVKELRFGDRININRIWLLLVLAIWAETWL